MSTEQATKPCAYRKKRQRRQTKCKKKAGECVKSMHKAAVEFAARLDISVVSGWTRLEGCSVDAHHEAGGLPDVLERCKERTGPYPARVLVDKIHRNRRNFADCKERNIRLSGPALVRPREDAKPEKQPNYVDKCERVEVEQRSPLAKRCCGLGLITTRLQEPAFHCIAMSVLVLKRIPCALFVVSHWLLSFLCSQKKQPVSL